MFVRDIFVAFSVCYVGRESVSQTIKYYFWQVNKIQY